MKLTILVSVLPILIVALLVSAWIETYIRLLRQSTGTVALLVSAWIETLSASVYPME